MGVRDQIDEFFYAVDGPASCGAKLCDIKISMSPVVADALAFELGVSLEVKRDFIYRGARVHIVDVPEELLSLAWAFPAGMQVVDSWDE